MTFAWTALALWPVISVVFFRTMRLPAAICTTIIGGYLLLPELIYFDLPVLPRLHKTSISSLTALIMTAITLGARASPFTPVPAPSLPGWIPRDPVARLLLVLLVLGTFGTILTNSDPVFVGTSGFIPGLRLYDAFSVLLTTLVAVVVPLLLGRKVLASPEGQRAFLVLLVVSAAVYGWGALFEARMSPQIHWRIYGFGPSDRFFQSIRDGGWRPNVMLRHGLHLAIFVALATVSAVGLFRITRSPARWIWAALAGWLFLILVVCKSLGAMVLAVGATPVVLLFRPRVQILAAACISAAVLTYPAMRAANVVPTNDIVNYIASINPARAQSFDFRVRNEEILLEKARTRPVFGWGGFARNRVTDELGRDISVTDGAWVVEFGTGGWVRYIAVFGLLAWPGIALLFRKRESLDRISAVMALVLSVKLLDLLPNAELVPVIWLMAGSLLGRLEMRDGIPEERSQEAEISNGYARRKEAPAVTTSSAKPVYARSFPGQKEKASREKNPGAGQGRRRGLYRRNHQRTGNKR